VIGNSAYLYTPQLPNPKNDAVDIGDALKKHGFLIIEGFDLGKLAFDRKVREFANALSGAEAGLFFFAGHGLQAAGRNYLMPIDAKLDDGGGLDFEMVQIDVIQRTMERQTNTNILFLDACRNNPLARNLARSMGARSSDVGRGLAAVESGVGTLISFSTQPGNVAQDGEGRNSPFAGALIKHISGATDDLSAILIAVRNDVMRQTQRKQVPWEHSALTGRFYFNSSASVPKSAEVTKTLVEHPQGPFDGIWKGHRTSTNCRDTNWYFTFQITKGQVQGLTRTSKITGNVSTSGEVTFNHTGTSRETREADGKAVLYTGVLSGNTGSGTFYKSANCSGAFTATRLPSGQVGKPKQVD
jgi:hypothetical protein